ncbi:hypothetical protein [Streptomyces sp. ML-6]|uniref:hypothetical protein n=1 Tax=Streptomyces sp. ML-6 TaxID=2982693 RepID=UPI0024BF15E6|nr:hypothetical protein [Streptomyces sp. ML-6]MDK0517717.1 hypothetical protein [Streptomyces sp. ML-6]
MRRAAYRALGLMGAAALLLGGCNALNTDKTPARVKSGVSELDLEVTGRPTPGSLSVTERVLARLGAGDVDGLAGLAVEGEGSGDDAKRWVARWGEAARRPATARFFPGEKESTVDIRFAGERGTLSLRLKDKGYDDEYGVVLGEDG